MRQTPNLKLPQWENNDKTSWLTQLNAAMLMIDTAVHSIALRTSIDGVSETAISDIEKLNSAVAELQTQYNTVLTMVNSLAETSQHINTTVASHTSQLNTLTINYTNLDTRISTAELKQQNTEDLVAKLQENINALETRVSALENK